MYIILGATGHVGSAVADALLGQGESVTIITHDTSKADTWRQKGAQVAVADVHDSDALRQVFINGKRLFLLNPPANPSTDTATEERKSLVSILAAIAGSGLEKIVAESTYGAQPGDRIGDLSVLYDMEEALRNQPVPASIIRAAYYMSNWDASLQTAQQEGKVHTLYPPDFALPMVAPDDIGKVAARLLTEPATKTGIHYVEGPQRYTSADVARALSAVLNKPVVAVQTPQDQWIPTLRDLGFSDKAAESMANMTAVTLNQPAFPQNYERGATTLEAYIRNVVHEAAKA
ncbi:NmrA family NAD(P)-binding protein [Fibrella sp. USSR17]